MMPLLFRFARAYAFLGRLTYPRVLLLGLFAAVAIEAVTVILRFGFRLESQRDTSALASFTFGLRIHHGYLGVVLAVAALFVRDRAARNLVLIVAVGLVLSDLFHHFLVLWPIYGDPQFYLVYGSVATLGRRLPLEAELLEPRFRFG